MPAYHTQGPGFDSQCIRNAEDGEQRLGPGGSPRCHCASASLERLLSSPGKAMTFLPLADVPGDKVSSL